MKSSNIGGQAVMEGIMMRHGDVYSISVRKPDQEIETKTEDYKSVFGKHRWMKLPILRGVVSFVDSLVVGTKCLMYSASFFEDEEETDKTEKVKEAEKKSASKDEKKEEEGIPKWMMAATVTFSIVLSVGLFMVLPYLLASLLRGAGFSENLVTIVEAFIRLAIFFGYMLLISKMKDIQRVFMYHGAEHKCINCIEHGMELNVENVMKSSRLHKRCGTSFLFIVIIVSIIFFLGFFAIFPISTLWLRVLVRVLLVPVIAGIAFEFIRLAGRSDNKIVTALSRPGMALQKLTTREPSPDQVEVAIAAVEAVFDWKAYLKECGL